MPDPLIFYALMVAVVGELAVLVIWCFALAKLRTRFLWVLVLSALLILVFVSFNAVMSYNPRILMQYFGRDRFKVVYSTIIWAQAANIFVFIIGQIMLVRWMLRAGGERSSVKTAAFGRRF